ncbi:peptide/nickel transport system ATP-binding protein [Pullulanibacillus pueri]|uniref:Peptide ABC transporter ATP-binding protein n=1 Tax=Pullulanibacillus pueri TaxID=1437324 RepID=A0A8J2ZXB1_9BACL|nr:ABC transporter ATP-binding protein [Pullulanibacillus pueri]MBM7682865.1 peptide/nickel transport system ATP-binding protein [Pullulanibacillus pueri]GGH84326.1 peptide ABC transporter ATP-binding protein [Pullulanibacillus pueri]
MTGTILEVSQLKTSFFTENGEVPAVSDVTFRLEKGEILGVVGESGCGKSVTSLSIMGLVEQPGKVVGGHIAFKGEDLTQASAKKMRQIRGNDIAMIYQDPMSALNPVHTIGAQLMECLGLHHKATRKSARRQAIECLERVGLPQAEQLMHYYPHQLSGGMCQRVMIAMAMICEPEVLIADEPTTALDVTIQAQILELMKTLNREFNTSIIFITHDLGVVAEICDRVLVMYNGRVVEQGTIHTLFKAPKHPYTKGLIQSVPDVREKKQRLYSIPGMVPSPGEIKKGCPFAPRCERALAQCYEIEPPFIKYENGDAVRCLLYEAEKKEVTTHGRIGDFTRSPQPKKVF